MSASPSLLRGEIVLTVFPFTDLSGSKRRPAVVLAVNADHPDVILAFISSVLPTHSAAADLLLLPADPDFPQSGLKVPSVIRLNKLATLDRQLITRRIGTLTAQRLQRLDEKIVTVLGVDLELFYRQERQRLQQLFSQQGMQALLESLQSS
jgi:mRNA interferase MazF